MSESEGNEEVWSAFRKHVPEVAAGVVELVSVAREPGSRLLVAVRSHDTQTHPVSACVGKDGARIKSITAELGGEKIAVLQWSDSVKELIMHTMLPGRMGRSRTPAVTLNATTRQARVQVEPETLERMTTNDGLLLRLASRLVGWDIKLSPYDNSSAN